MGQVLEALQRLQAAERRLVEIRRERESRLHRVDFHRRQVRQAEERIHQTELNLRQRQIRLDALQLDVASREDAVAKHRQALNRAKTNREYAAILTTINTEKADNAKLETEILQMMDEIQRLSESVQELKAERARLEEDVIKAEELLRAYEERSTIDLKQAQAEREECAAQIDSATLAAFDRVAERHDGEALAPLIKVHPRRDEFTCSGCNLQVTLEVVNALQTRDELQVCKVCGRILYLEPAPAKQRSRV